jgi:osmotically inducible protein OsmC
MALAGGLGRAGTPPTRLESEARTTFEKVGEGFRITRIALTIRGEVDGIDDEAFQQAAEGAAENCPVSQALKGNVEVTLDAHLL